MSECLRTTVFVHFLIHSECNFLWFEKVNMMKPFEGEGKFEETMQNEEIRD